MNRYFSKDERCPVCGSSRYIQVYPIDRQFAEQVSKLDSIPVELGVADCLGCQHQFIYPVPTQHFLKNYYTNYMSVAKNGFYQARNSDDIPAMFDNYYSPWLSLIYSNLKKPKPRLLDIGCGLGMFLRLAREKGFEVFGVEPNQEAVERLATEYSIKAYNTLLEGYHGDEFFDVVTMWDLLEHLVQPQAAVDKVHSMLNPDGLLVLEIPIRDSLLHWTAKLLYRLSLGAIKRPLFLTYGVHHLQYFSEKSIVSFIEKSGFEVIERKRSETSLDALKKNGPGLRPCLYNVSLSLMFGLAKFINKKNKLILIARKRHS